MANMMMLFLKRENEGEVVRIEVDTPRLPSQFDALSESLLVSPSSIPAHVFSGQNYTGQMLKLVGGGGCDDLSTLPGKWFHKIRSVRFAHALLEREPGTEVKLRGDVVREPPPLIKQSTRGISLQKIGEEGDPSPLGTLDIPQSTVSGRNDSRLYSDEFYERAKVLPSVTTAWMERVFDSYSNSCTCGTHYDNNSAHFLSNAMAVNGCSFPSGLAKCPTGRPIRAKELRDWFRRISTGYAQNHDSLSSGYWFVYQESGGQGHVLVHREASASYAWRGTGDYPFWSTQWHYFY